MNYVGLMPKDKRHNKKEKKKPLQEFDDQLKDQQKVLIKLKDKILKKKI